MKTVTSRPTLLYLKIVYWLNFKCIYLSADPMHSFLIKISIRVLRANSVKINEAIFLLPKK